MFRAFLNAFKVPDLRGKILFTLAIIAVFRLGSFIPIPGVDYGVLQGLRDQSAQAGATAVINLFSGGALTQLAIFALGIMPYITASIIMQLLTVVIPRLEEWQKEGESGTKRITQMTRYLTVALAVLQSTALLVVIGNDPSQLFGGAAVTGALIPDTSWYITALQVLTLTAGTAFIMYLGELITQRGIGNGMSLLIFASVISQLPSQGNSLYSRDNGAIILSVALLIVLLLIVGVVYVEQAQRRIQVQYASRQVGRKRYGGNSTYIPLKVNQAGVIPIIFASSLLYLPTLGASIIGNQAFTDFVNQYLNANSATFSPFPTILTFLMIIFFAYFYTSITFNPTDVADNMKKYGGFLPGIRPGRPTAEYLSKVLNRITLPGALYLGVLAIIPMVALAFVPGVSLPLGGSSLLIAVGVALETMKQLESQLLQRNYEGFLRT